MDGITELRDRIQLLLENWRNKNIFVREEDSWGVVNGTSHVSSPRQAFSERDLRVVLYKAFANSVNIRSPCEKQGKQGQNSTEISVNN